MQSSPGSASEGGQVHDVAWGLVGTWIQGSLMLGRQGVEELSQCPEPSDSLFSKSVLPQTGVHRSCFGVSCLGCPRLGAEVAKLLWPSSTTGAFQGMQLSWVPSTEVEQQLYSL